MKEKIAACYIFFIITFHMIIFRAQLHIKAIQTESFPNHPIIDNVNP